VPGGAADAALTVTRARLPPEPGSGDRGRMAEEEQHEQEQQEGSGDWIAGATINAASQPTSVGSVQVSFAGLDLPRPQGHDGDGATAYA